MDNGTENLPEDNIQNMKPLNIQLAEQMSPHNNQEATQGISLNKSIIFDKNRRKKVLLSYDTQN